MRALVLAGAAALAVATPAYAIMPIPPATPDKLEQLATIVEGMHGNSTIVDQRLADMIRPLAAAQGVTIPATAPPYTLYMATAQKLRPKGWLVGGGELPDGSAYMVASKYDIDGKFTSPDHQRSGRNSGVGQAASALALDAALLRAWAQELREAGSSL